MSPESGIKVRLKSFNGTLEPLAECKREENYWRLIGQSGVVAASDDAGPRVLVKFDEPASGAGLYCHNDIPNSLLILQSDLDFAISSDFSAPIKRVQRPAQRNASAHEY